MKLNKREAYSPGSESVPAQTCPARAGGAQQNEGLWLVALRIAQRCPIKERKKKSIKISSESKTQRVIFQCCVWVKRHVQ